MGSGEGRKENVSSPRQPSYLPMRLSQQETSLHQYASFSLNHPRFGEYSRQYATCISTPLISPAYPRRFTPAPQQFSLPPHSQVQLSRSNFRSCFSGENGHRQYRSLCLTIRSLKSLYLVFLALQALGHYVHLLLCIISQATRYTNKSCIVPHYVSLSFLGFWRFIGQDRISFCSVRFYKGMALVGSL